MKAAAIILAAGKSTRMKSDVPKVLHEVCGRPMLAYVLDACRSAGVDRLVVVVGHRKEDVIAAFAGEDGIEWVAQTEQKGTAHAALMCAEALEDFTGPVLTIAGDMPLIRGETVSAVLAESVRTGHAVTLATSVLDDPTGYGRIVRDVGGELTRIVEDRECTETERAIREVNISYYCFDGRRLFCLLRQIGTDNAKGEYYITDTVSLAIADGSGAGAIPAVPQEDALGINSRADVAQVNRVMQERIQRGWLDRSVSIVDRQTTWIEAGAELGAETVIYPFTYVGAGAEVGTSCRLGPHAVVPRGERLPAGSIVMGSSTSPLMAAR